MATTLTTNMRLQKISEPVGLHSYAFQVGIVAGGDILGMA